VLQLQGELGAGKTVFVKGIAEEMGIDPRGVSSPTFVLANLYDIPKGGGSLHHVDFYRLEAFEELEDMGFFDLIVPEALLAVEWGDRFPSALPADRLELKLSSEPEAGSEMRTLLVRARGRSSRIWLERWRRNLDEEGVRVS
jgi:tRNA threonylcarbamoyladenosine biosynthesis protein TsaE